MGWKVLRCSDTGKIWLWERRNGPEEAGNVADGKRHLIPEENTRLALYGQYPVFVVPHERDLGSIPIGEPRGRWPYHASLDPVEAERAEHYWSGRI
jgi:hypothetical protein